MYIHIYFNNGSHLTLHLTINVTINIRFNNRYLFIDKNQRFVDNNTNVNRYIKHSTVLERFIHIGMS